MKKSSEPHSPSKHDLGSNTQRLQRRDFIKFLGRSGIALSSLTGLSAFSGCTQSQNSKKLTFPSLEANSTDTFDLVEGLNYKVLLKYGDPLNSKDVFGYNCDFNAFYSLNSKSTEAILWTNHEFIEPYFVTKDRKTYHLRKKDQIDLERKMVGGSLSHIKLQGDHWTLIKNSPFNRRLDANTSIPFVGGDQKLENAIGTLGNCAGGMTPWNTFLSCEENYHEFYGEVISDGKTTKRTPSEEFGWENIYPNHSVESYGWVVEIEPKTGESKKLIPLGRFAHESATCVTAKDGRVVVYMGDDKPNECFYKFISSSADSLEKGDLYVANLANGRWEHLHFEKNPKLKGYFKSQTDLLIQTRKAARLAGGTPLDRPEDVEVDPLTNNIYLCCTNNPVTKVLHGSILKFQERDSDFLSLEFKSDIWLKGGPEAGFSSPDNLVFDRNGNLWLACDVSEKYLNKGEFKSFGNNSLFYVPTSGSFAGKAFRVACGPVDAELTGLCFSPDYETLFLSVQHPGSTSPKKGRLTSHWPEGAPNEPKPSVIAIRGPLLKKLINA